jgi:hypothetical protein
MNGTYGTYGTYEVYSPISPIHAAQEAILTISSRHFGKTRAVVELA